MLDQGIQDLWQFCGEFQLYLVFYLVLDVFLKEGNEGISDLGKHTPSNVKREFISIDSGN